MPRGFPKDGTIWQCRSCGRDFLPLSLSHKFCDREDCTRGSKSEQERRYRYKRKWGLSIEEFEAMIKKQDGKCAICSTNVPGGAHNVWHIDHDHETDEIRGLLCSKCNIGLGHFQDDFELLQKASEYLKLHSSKENVKVTVC